MEKMIKKHKIKEKFSSTYKKCLEDKITQITPSSGPKPI